MNYLRLTGPHYEMGVTLGSVFKANGVKFSLSLDDFQSTFGKKSQALLRGIFPEAVEEIKGLTDQVKIDTELFTSWMMCMGCCLYNMDRESLVETRGCTAFAFRNNGKCYYGRNNDLPPYLENGCKSIYYSPQGANSFLLDTSSFINGEEGINDKGLVVAMTFVAPHLDQIRPGFNAVFIVRYLLEKCDTANEALTALKQLPVASSCNILLCDKSGEMLVAECSAEQIHIRHPLYNDRDEPYIITVNNFTSPDMIKYENHAIEDYASKRRYATADSALAHHVENPLVFSKKLLSGEYGFMCQYDHPEVFKTVWSSIFDICNNKLLIAEGTPEVDKYKEFTE